MYIYIYIYIYINNPTTAIICNQCDKLRVSSDQCNFRPSLLEEEDLSEIQIGFKFIWFFSGHQPRFLRNFCFYTEHVKTRENACK